MSETPVTQTEASAQPQPEPDKERLWTTGFLLVCGSAMFFWTTVFFHGPLLPLYMDASGLSEGTIGFVVGSGAIAALIGRALSGWAVDRWGTRMFVFWGAMTWAVTSPLMALTTNLALLVTYRLIQGFGLAIFLNASLAQMAKVAPEGRRGAAVGWWGITNNMANAVGPAVAVWIMQDFGWMVAFVTAGIVAAVGGIIGLFPTKADADAEEDAEEDASKAKFRMFTAGAVLPGIVGTALGFAAGAFITFAPLLAKDLGMANEGYYLAVLAVAMVLARLTLGPLSDKKGRIWAILPGLVLLILSMILVGLIFDPLFALIVPFMFGLGVGGAMPGLIAWTLDRTKPSERGLAGSTFYFLYEIGLFIGAYLLGLMLEEGSYNSYLLVAGVLCLVLVLYLWSLRKREATPNQSN